MLHNRLHSQQYCCLAARHIFSSARSGFFIKAIISYSNATPFASHPFISTSAILICSKRLRQFVRQRFITNDP
ncbi:MAG: hypothetical protein H7320_15660 [Ferruginibacter sp.]|nr:hypothetical protein [Ferruginibacter sp.]